MELNQKLIHDSTDKNIFNILKEEKLTFYIGIDPTADSMHVGHLSSFMFAKRLEQMGHNPIIIVGGMTAMIGDPSGKSSERTLQTLEDINKNAKALEKQVKHIFGKNFKIINNYDWLNMPLPLFLRDFGKLFGVNQMLAKDIVASRLDTGISFTEFSYQILQSIDYNHLFQTENCTLQIGGQDQWGNITAGLELIRKQNGHEAKAYGITLPLLLKSDGTKFGKSESGTVWLDETKTSPYELYQFFYNTPDDMILNLVDVFTFAEGEELETILEATKNEPFLRTAQKYVASKVVEMVHGKDALYTALKITEALFSGDIASLSNKELKSCIGGLPTHNVEDNIDVQDLLVQANAAKGRKEARSFIESGAVSINGIEVTDVEQIMTKSAAVDKEFHIIKRGKRKYFVAKYK